MSGRGGVRVNNNGGGGKSEIPAGCRKMVQSLKEIVNCSESEIYSMLQECNMDPNEAVGRLLSQDTFHEVKSKREKKKENKDGTDNRFRGANNISQRSGRGGSDRYGRGGSTQFSSNDSGVSHGKPAYRKENGVHAYSGSSYSDSGSSYSASAIPSNNINMRPPLHSDSVATDNKMLTTSAVDGVSSSSKPSSGFQSSWLGVPGQVSMADIVKMGRPQNRAPAMPPHQGGNHGHLATSTITASHHDLHAPDVHASKVPEISAQSGVAANDHTDFNDEWPSIEQPPVASASSVLEVPVSQLYDAPSSLPMDITKHHMKAELDDYHSSEYTLNGNLVGSASVPSRSVQEDVSGDSSLFDNNNLYGNESSYHSHRHAFEHNEAEDISASVVANLQRLSVHDNEQETSGDEEDPPVIIPTHLQVHAQECSHLSFGSFGAGIGSTTSGSFATRPLENSLEETPEEVDASSGGHLDTRKKDYYGDEQLNNGDEENLVHRTGGDAVTYSSPSVQQAEVPDEASVAPQANQSAYPTAAPGFAYDNSQQLSAAYDNPQASSQMQNVAPFSSVVQQAYTNSLPSTLLSSDIPTGREPDLSYLSFPMSQPMGTKYGTAAPSNNGPSISMPEALRGSSISPQPTPQTLAGANIATGPALPQQLPVHPYSQPTLPLGHYANMIGYPFLPQSYTYMPSAFQQNFAGNNTYHQSLAAMLPQYKNNVSASNLPQSAGVASGYGFGSSTSIPAGNFPLNNPTVSVGTTIGYEDVLGSQYKEVNHLISLQQNESSAMWLHGPGSRTMSAVPASTYYNMQGQNQQPSGFRQGQQPSQQHYGALGYPNYYHSQTGVLMEHQQQQNPREGSLGGSQGQAGKQTQLWQSSY